MAIDCYCLITLRSIEIMTTTTTIVETHSFIHSFILHVTVVVYIIKHTHTDHKDEHEKLRYTPCLEKVSPV